MIMIQNKPMGEILKRMELMEFLEIIIFDETMILNDPIDSWPICDCLISFHSKGISLFYRQARHPWIKTCRFRTMTRKLRNLGPDQEPANFENLGPQNRRLSVWLEPRRNPWTNFKISDLGFPLEKAIQYEKLRKPFVINDLEKQWDIQGLVRSIFVRSFWFAIANRDTIMINIDVHDCAW